MEIDSNIRKKNVKNIMIKFIDILKENNIYKDNKKDIEEISALIESGILKFSIEYAEANNTPFLLESIYSDKVYNITSLFNLEVIESILNKIIEPKELAFFSEEDLNPKKFREFNKKKNKIKEIKDNQTTVSAYTCKKCKGNRTTTKEIQIQRGDEPTTFFIKCLDCGYVEKQES